MRGTLWRGAEDAAFLTTWVPAGTTVLELGCGDGKYLEALGQAGFAPLGLDFAPTALELARRKTSAGVVMADLTNLPIRRGGAPAVAARHVLGALRAGPRAVVATEITRALSPGGILFIEEFSKQDFRHGRGQEVEPSTFERNRGILTHYFGQDEIPALFAALTLLHTEPRQSLQRVGTATAIRHRWRWVLSRQPKDSSGAPRRSRS